MLQQRLAEQLEAFEDDVHLMNGIPMSLCGLTRASRCQSFPGMADDGYCADKDEMYYGVHGHLLSSGRGGITGFSLTAANGSEWEALWDTVPQIHGRLIGDRGDLGQFLQPELSLERIDLPTALRCKMKDDRDRQGVQLLQRVRRLIETVIGQLTDRFKMEKVRARDRWHLTSRCNRQLLAHTVCFWLNRHSPDPLQLDDLVTED